MEYEYINNKDDNGETNVFAKSFIKCVFDENGERLFNDDDYEYFNSDRIGLETLSELRRIGDIIMGLNGIAKFTKTCFVHIWFWF